MGLNRSNYVSVTLKYRGKNILEPKSITLTLSTRRARQSHQCGPLGVRFYTQNPKGELLKALKILKIHIFSRKISFQSNRLER